MMMALLGDFRWHVRRDGVPRTTRRLLSRAARRLAGLAYARRVAVIHCADLDRWPDYQPAPGIQVREAVQADLDRLAEELPPSTIRKYLKRREEGDTMFAAESGGELGGYAWMSTRADGHAAKTHGLTLSEGEGIHWDSYTLPQFRRKGIYTALHRFSRSYMKARGLKRVYGAANLDNPAALKMVKTLALRPLRMYRTRRILGVERHWTEPLPPGFSF